MPLIVDLAVPRYTRRELVHDLADRFGSFTDSTLRLWQSNGLAAPARRGSRWAKGKEGSSPALYSEHDRQMLIALLEKRREIHDAGLQFSFDQLANLVVWSWIYWDDVVLLPQARRALRTWTRPRIGGQAGSARSKNLFEAQVRAALESLAPPNATLDASGRNAARQLAELMWTGDVAGLRLLEPALTAVIDPDGVGRRVGALGVNEDAAQELERLQLIQIGALAVVTGSPSTSDGLWRRARSNLRTTWVEYSLDWPRLARSTDRPTMFKAPSVELQLADASRTLLFMIGLALRDLAREPSGDLDAPTRRH